MKAFYPVVLLFCLGWGCAITDYGVITDNDQIRNGDPASTIVNTNGKAHLKTFFNVAAIYADGTDNLFAMVDQKSDGTSVITNYNNFSTLDEPALLDNKYCNPDWNGCSIFTAPDNNDNRLFDGSLNPNCSGARSLSLLVGTSRWYGECGRAKVALEDRLTLLNKGSLLVDDRLSYIMNRSNVTVRLQNQETQKLFNIPIFGSIDAAIRMGGDRSMIVDATHSMLQHSIGAVQDVVTNEGVGPYTVLVEYMGVELDLNVAFISDDRIARYRAMHF